MSERRTIGEILTSVGRISEDDVEAALAYQRERGGYFGEALVACGLVTQEEVEWGLASQFDLPYVFPDPDAVDPEAAALVSPEWALSHLTIPILKTEHALKVLVESPANTGPVEELRSRTELEIELALASPAGIRELIRQVYARGTAADETSSAPIDLDEALRSALEFDTPRFGISIRGARGYVWWDERGTVRRSPLSGDWRGDLDRVLRPGPGEMTAATTRTHWDAELDVAGSVRTVEVHFIADESGSEFLFEPREAAAAVEHRFTPPPAGVLSEVRLLARSGAARFIVVTEPPELGHEILPHLPMILFDPSWRSIYVNARPRRGAEEAFSLQMPDDPATWSRELEALRAFHFDVVTVDLSGSERGWAGSALDIASVAFLLWNAADDTRPAREAGIRWTMRIARAADDELAWSLEPLHPS